MLESRLIWMLLVLAATSRLALIIFAQTDGGDSRVYEVLAENIMRGCGLSHSDPNSNQCSLTSAGYFPGYPAFMAITWMVFGKSVQAVLLIQLVCYLIALYWLLVALWRLTASKQVIFYTGLVFALSPLQVGWFRFILTEPLAIATSIWFLAELIFSVSAQKLRSVHLSIALSASIYVRPDAIFMFVGVLFVSFYFHENKKAFRDTCFVILLTTFLVSGWLVRNVAIGHAPLSMVGEMTPKAPGYFFWLNTWVVNEYERADANFPVWRAEYSKIDLHHSKYVSDDERKAAKLLIQELSAMDGKQFPKDIDQKFEELASLKIQTQNHFMPYAIFIERVGWLLFNPFSSWGLPLEIKDINKPSLNDSIVSLDLNRAMSLLNGYKSTVAGKIMVFSYRAIIFIGFIIVVGYVIFGRVVTRMVFFRSAVKGLVAGVVAVTVTRLTFFVYLGGLESRYLAEVVPWVEFCVVLFFVGNDRCLKGTRQVATIG
jgi:hypothetical protein